MQRGGLLESAAEGVDPLRVRVKAGAERVEIAGLRCAHDSLDRLHLIVRTGLASLQTARHELDRPLPPILGDLIKRAAVDVGRCRTETRRKGAPDRFDVAGPRGLENAIAVARRRMDAVDMGLEGTPAGEAIVAGNRELGLILPGIGKDGDVSKALEAGSTLYAVRRSPARPGAKLSPARRSSQAY
jgi:hypothetical protein